MICNKCGFIKSDEGSSEENDIQMYICKNCSIIFCSKCAEKGGNKCLNAKCSSDLVLIDENLEYLLFDQGWRHIKKGGFG